MEVVLYSDGTQRRAAHAAGEHSVYSAGVVEAGAIFRAPHRNWKAPAGRSCPAVAPIPPLATPTSVANRYHTCILQHLHTYTTPPSLLASSAGITHHQLHPEWRQRRRSMSYRHPSAPAGWHESTTLDSQRMSVDDRVSGLPRVDVVHDWARSLRCWKTHRFDR